MLDNCTIHRPAIAESQQETVSAIKFSTTAQPPPPLMGATCGGRACAARPRRRDESARGARHGATVTAAHTALVSECPTAPRPPPRAFPNHPDRRGRGHVTCVGTVARHGSARRPDAWGRPAPPPPAVNSCRPFSPLTCRSMPCSNTIVHASPTVLVTRGSPIVLHPGLVVSSWSFPLRSLGQAEA